MATAFFYKRITELDQAGQDQDHFEILIDSRPSIPKRVEYILGLSEEDPLPQLADVARKLEKGGAQILAMPCITAHYFYQGIASRIRVPLIHGIKETGEYLKSKNILKVGLLGTRATIDSALIQNELQDYGISCVIPEPGQQEQIGKIIARVKAGKTADGSRLSEIMESLEQKGAGTCLLACTELSILHQTQSFPGRYIDMMDILAAAAVRECGYLNQELFAAETRTGRGEI